MKTIALLLALATANAHAVLLYGVDASSNLISFDSATPGTTLSSAPIQNLSGASVLAMDFRVISGVTYVLTSDKELRTLDLVTGATALFAAVPSLTGIGFAFDFNPTNNNLRIVSNDNTNYVYSFVTNALIPGINVAYGAGDPLSGVDPDIAAAAYLNNDTSAGTGTVLYVLDSKNDVLATQNAATGVLTRIGSLGINAATSASFDIFTDDSGNNSPFAYSDGQLYTVNLASGALTGLGATDRNLVALTAVPEPATTALFLLGGLGLLRRRR
jgi:Domain of unknown function (DUF4394)/PEP-CTERM motif